MAALEKIRYRLKRLKSNVKWPLDEMPVGDGLLFRKRVSKFVEDKKVVYLPQLTFIRFGCCHSSPTAGQEGVNVSLARCQDFVTWPSMKRDAKTYVRQ